MEALRATLLVAGLLVFNCEAAAANSALDPPMLPPMGQYTVGFRLVEQYDTSRTFAYRPSGDSRIEPKRARPLQTLIWYPARGPKGREQTFRDYVELTVREVDFDAPRPKPDDVLMGNAFKPHYDEHLQTYASADPVTGRFPVVVYAPSSSSFSWENVDLCRYLASHGYVVLASPGMGVGRQTTADQASIDAQARDVSFLVGYAGSLPNADSSRVAVGGFSWGGLSGLFAAARDSRIKAIVAMEGSLRYVPWIIAESRDVRPESMTLPLLFFKGQWTLEDQEREYRRKVSADLVSPNVLNAWTHGDLVSVQMLGLSHPEFNSATHRLESFWEKEFPRLQQADYDRSDGRVGYSWVARYTLAFLDSYLKGDTKAADFLAAAPRDNGVPAHTMAVTIRKAEPLAVPASR